MAAKKACCGKIYFESAKIDLLLLVMFCQFIFQTLVKCDNLSKLISEMKEKMKLSNQGEKFQLSSLIPAS